MLLNDPYYCYNEVPPLEMTANESLQMLMNTFAETTILPVPEAHHVTTMTYHYQAVPGYGYDMQSNGYEMVPTRSADGYFESEEKNFVSLLSMHEPAEQKCEWMHKNVGEWTPHDTKTWILDTAVEKRLKLSQIPSFQFSHITGVELSDMTKEAFCENMSTEGSSFESILIGETLYEALQSRLMQETLVPATITDKYNKNPEANYLYNPEQTEGEKRLYDMDSNYGISVSPNPRNVNNLDSGYDSSISEDCEPKFREEDMYVEAAAPMEEAAPVTIKRPPGRPKGSGKKLTKRMKNVSVPEFLRDLLLNPSYCPRIIKWEDYSKGKFRFVKANEVAQLWGGKKNNKKMSFEKFSRAMRYHYKQGVLVSVPTARLVYQFGPKAPQYSTPNPNFEGSLSDR